MEKLKFKLSISIVTGYFKELFFIYWRNPISKTKSITNYIKLNIYVYNKYPIQDKKAQSRVN